MTGVFYLIAVFFFTLLIGFASYVIIKGFTGATPEMFAFARKGSIGNQLFNTIYLVFISLLFSIPLGVTAGIYLAGACQAPKDIPETVGMASGAAVKVAGLFSQANLVREPLIAVVNRTAPPLFSTCVGCFMCQTACPYQAIERDRKSVV